MRWSACKKHDGKHIDVHGQCVHRGAPAALRPARCVDCGAETMRRLDLTDGTVTTVEAGSDQLHQHAPPIRVELDPDILASAIVSASRAARQERKPTPVTPEQQTPYVRPPARNGHANQPLGGIPELSGQ